MRAIVYSEYGPPEVLRLSELEMPTPKDDEVLIRIRAASVNPIDWHFMRGTPYAVRLVSGLRRPRVTRLGIDVAGRVEAAGKNVTRFQAGDDVFGACKGAFAEIACAPENALALKPKNVTFEQAAAVPVAGLSALQALRDKGQIRPGQKVLINGASGGVGTFAVQLANEFGAEVTGVCSSRNADLVRQRPGAVMTLFSIRSATVPCRIADERWPPRGPSCWSEAPRADAGWAPSREC
jgi:NADPH:quinone reductase-like Zn-dependent oxidoreductase